jgi:hypothetical protein
MPPGFKMPNEAAPDVLLAMRMQINPNDGGQNYNTLARLRPGISAARIDADLKNISRQIIAEHPDVLGGKKSALAAKSSAGFVPMSFTDAYVGTLQRTLWIFLGAVGFVALIACANVANLLLVRAAGREREIAVRATLGRRTWTHRATIAGRKPAALVYRRRAGPGRWAVGSSRTARAGAERAAKG